jgi:hypothetical protein
VFLVCLPEGRQVVTVTARSGFEITRKLVLAMDIVGPMDCRPWTVRDDPEFSHPARVAAASAAASAAGGER